MTDYGHYCDARCLYAGSPNPQGDRLRRRPSTRRGTPGAGGTRTEEARGFRGAAVESATSRRDPDRPTDRPTVRPSVRPSLPPSLPPAARPPPALPHSRDPRRALVSEGLRAAEGRKEREDSHDDAAATSSPTTAHPHGERWRGPPCPCRRPLRKRLQRQRRRRARRPAP